MTYGAGIAKYDVSGWHNIKSISLYECELFGLKKNGTVIAVPERANECVSDWSDIIEVSATTRGVIGLKKDGTIVYEGISIGEEAENEISQWTNLKVTN